MSKLLAMTPTTSEVAATVRAEMARQRVTQRDVAKALKVSHATINRRISGEVPFDVEELATIADLLGLSIADLIPSDTKASA